VVTSPAVVPSARKPARLVVAGGFIGVISIILLVMSIMLSVRTVMIAGEDFAVPGSQAFQVEPGQYAVWLAGSPFLFFRGDITVTGPAGDVEVRLIAPDVVLFGDVRPYVAIAEFNAEVSGRYDVTVHPDPDYSSRPMVARVAPAMSRARQDAGGIIFIVASLLALVALILTILGLVKWLRARARARRLAGGGPGPGAACGQPLSPGPPGSPSQDGYQAAPPAPAPPGPSSSWSPPTRL
jgi:hypothetical protein